MKKSLQYLKLNKNLEKKLKKIAKIVNIKKINRKK